MKLLFDENLSYRLVRLLADVFPGSEQVRRLGLLQKMDTIIWAYARQYGFVITSQDEDFADLSAGRGEAPYVLLLRTGNLLTNELADFLRRNAAKIEEAFAPDTEIQCLTLYRIEANR